MPSEWQAIWAAINIVGWPTVILGTYFKELWVAKKQADKEKADLIAAFSEAIRAKDEVIKERDRNYDIMVREKDAQRERETALLKAEAAENWQMALELARIAQHGTVLLEKKVTGDA